MKSNIVPKLPPSLRPRPKGPDISESFAPIVAAIKPSPPVGTSGSATAPTAPTATTPALKKSYVPKPTNDRVPKLEGRITLFEGSFKHESHPPFVVETPLSGDGKRDKQSLINLARKRYPTGAMQLKSTRIFSREEGAAATFNNGATLGQLFGPAGSDSEVTVEVGEVFFDSAKCQVMIRNLRSRNCVTFSLRQPTGGNINFSNQIQSNRLARELPSIVKEILGNGARELTITLKEAK